MCDLRQIYFRRCTQRSGRCLFFRLRSKPKFRGGGRRSGWCSSRVSCRRGIFLRRLLLVLLVVVVGLDCFSIAVKLWRVSFFWFVAPKDRRPRRPRGAACGGKMYRRKYVILARYSKRWRPGGCSLSSELINSRGGGENQNLNMI